MSATAHPPVDAREPSLAGARAWFAEHGLSRPREGRVLGGVAAAFARRYAINPLVARILAVTTVVVLSPIIYVGAWILLPADPDAEPASAA